MKYINLKKYEYVPGITFNKEFKVLWSKQIFTLGWSVCLIFVISFWQTIKFNFKYRK